VLLLDLRLRHFADGDDFGTTRSRIDHGTHGAPCFFTTKARRTRRSRRTNKNVVLSWREHHA
jgi:hypothetical protein